MAYDQSDAKKLLAEWTAMKDRRQRNWDTLFQQVKDVVWPQSEDFTVTRQPGTYLNELCYDSTAPWANGQFANGMHAAVANPFEQWFAILPQDDGLQDDVECFPWCQKVTKVVSLSFSHPQANHKQSLHKYFLGQGCQGTSCVSQEWDDDIDGPVFAAIPLADIWIAEDDKGRINKVHRMVKWTKGQAELRFGGENLPPQLAKEDVDPTEKWLFLHIVEPRDKRKINPNGKGYKDMKFRSCWLFIGGAIFGGGGGTVPAQPAEPFICWEGGYRTMPYHVGRWEPIEGEEYGRSPAMTALPDIKMINQMTKVTLRAAQKVVDPPLAVPHDTFMNQIDLTPGKVNYYDSTSGAEGKNAIFPLTFGANPELGEKIMEPKKESIKQCFYTDIGNIPFKKERQTTAEIQAQQDSILRNIAPLVGRQEAELLGPMIMRNFDLNMVHGKIPPAPAKMSGKKLKIVYVSRAALAIRGGELGAIKGFIAETIVPMAQIAPEVKDSLDCDAVVAKSARLANIDQGIFRSPKAVAAIRKDRANQQAQQQQLAAAESASTSLKNVGAAAQASPQLVGAGS